MDKAISEIQPKKALGQNFLLSKKALDEIVKLAELNPEDVVIEIGSGTGILTQELAKKVAKVIAVEKDQDLIPILQKNLCDFTNIEIIEGDIRELISNNQLLIDNKRYKVVANLPYYLSSFIIRRFLEINHKPQMMVLMLQKELAERICANPGKMSLISIMVNLYGEPSLGSIVKKENFYPKPKIDSRILTIRNIQVPDIDEKIFFRILKIGFSSKRKMLISNLKNGLQASREELQKVFKSLGINEKARSQELSLQEWKALVREIEKLITKNN